MDWDKKATKELRRLRDLGLTINEIADIMNLTYCQIETALRRNRIKYPKKKLITRDLKQLPPVEELINHVIKGQEIVRKFDPRQREGFPIYDTDKWIGIIFQGDWHFEHYKTDLRGLINDLKTIGEEEDVFYVFNGDVGDWADIRFEGYNLPSFIIPIDLRYKIIFHLISHIKNLLAVTAGCHDDWLKNRGFYDIIGAIKEKQNEKGLNTYYLGYGGILNFQVGQVKYKIAVYHKYGRESGYNDFHPCIKFLQNQDSSCDIVAMAHRHDKVGISYQYVQHKPKVFIRSGSHQYITDYAWKEGFIGAINECPMILLNGKEKRMKICHKYQEGIQDLRRLNNE